MKTEGINHISIIGTGMMGSSLATLCTGNGYATTMYAINDTEAERGRKSYDSNFRDLIKQGLVTEKQYETCKKLLKITNSYEDLADTDFILECVFEKLEVKYDVYKNIEKYCKKFKAIASSTSAISAHDLAQGLIQKDKLVVAHPWNPPHLVPCVEVVKSPYTSEETVKVVKDTLESMGRKVALMEKDAPGFIGNRLQHALIREAVNIIESGIAGPEDIDITLKYSFMPRYTSIGLFEHQDNAGLDLVDNIEKYLFKDLSTAQTTQKYIKDKVTAGDLGIKTGKGVYDWSKKDLNDFYYRAQKPYFQFFNWDLPQ
jgi:3-hydroxybutyryl-CoA dehydrogenase